MKKRLLLLSLCLTGLKLLAQTQAPSDLYLKTMNSYLPGSPEAGQIMKYQDYPVNLFTGTPEVSIPIYTVAGKGISVPISLSYHAGGGVKVDEQATNIGLGWAMNAGGEITREIRGISPDEGQGAISGFFYKPHPVDTYVNSYNLTAGTYTDFQLWSFAGTNVDLEPDIFYFSFGGYSGKYVYDDNLNEFTCLTQNSRIKIFFDQPTTTWKIITDDGTRYYFTVKETTSSQIANAPPGVTSPTYAAASPPQITSWKLSKIVNADATDSIQLSYAYTSYSYFTGGASIAYQTIQSTMGIQRSDINSFSKNNVIGFSKLTDITGSNFTVHFDYDPAYRLDLSAEHALSKVTVKNNSNTVSDIFELHHSYFSRSAGAGTPTLSADNSYALRLDSLTEYGNDISNANPLRHAFAYDIGPTRQLPKRLSYSQDFWGYYNDNGVNGNGSNTTLAPALSIALGNAFVSYPGADRSPDTAITGIGMLQEIRLPTGGTVHYNYESNSVGYPVSESAATLIPTLNSISVFDSIGQYFNNMYSDTFIVNQAPNIVVNNLQGGVNADIHTFPNTHYDPQHPNQLPSAGPHYELIRYANVDGTTSGGYDKMWQYGGVTNEHLPNGRYVMKAYTNTLNNDVSVIRSLFFSVNYDRVDDNTQNNYYLGGLRVKSIVTKDPYSNITNRRTFRYHDPVTDSSYGLFMGSNLSHYYESGGGYGEWYQYLVRMGSNNMPGQGNTISNVIYPKVIEDVMDNGITYRTEHNFTVTLPFYTGTWPFAPAKDVECGRGNEFLTEVKQQTSSGFAEAQRVDKVFDYDPTLYAAPNTSASRILYGIRCAYNTFDQSWMDLSGYPPEFILPYTVNINRLYLTSDSTTTYDIGNPNHGLTQWHDYVYGDNNMKPMIVRSGNSDGSVSIQKNYYACDTPDANGDINGTLASQMVAANRVSQPLGTTQYKDGQQLSQQYTYSHFSGNQLLVDSMRQALFNNPLDAEIKVQSYSPFANPLSILLRGNKYRKYIWNDTLGLPLATCVAGQDSKFVFTSFEYNNEIPWINTSRTTTNAFSGKYAYNLLGATISITGLSSTTGMDVYVWATGSSVAVNSTTLTSTGKTKGSWTLYTTHVGNVSTISLAGNALIDQLLVLPTGSQFEGNVYDGMNRVSSVVNDQIETSFYEYDNFGRLTTVKDEQGNILKSTSYQYQGPQ